MTAAGFPVGWSLPRLDQIARVTSGKRLPKGRSVTAMATLHPYIRVTDMRMGKVDLLNIHYVPDDVAPKISRYTVDAGDLYISCAGTLGIVGLVSNVLHGANLTENANRISGIQINPHFLLHVLMSEMIQGHIQNIQTVGAQPKLALGRIRSFEIPCPDEPKEQEAIAEALSDADALIEGVERLIAKKRLIKRGAMQELLTGRRRLPGFSGEWVEVLVSECARVSRMGCNPSDEPEQVFEHYSLPAFDAGEAPAFEKGKDIQSNKFRVPEGALLVSKLNPRIPRVWSPSVQSERAVCSTEFFVLLPNENFERNFLHQVFLSPNMIDEMTNRATGTTGSHQRIAPRTFASLVLRIPSPQEQREIAAVLEDVDAEIQALETRLEKARQVKEGMMQNLLTGRIRLV